MKDDQIIVQQLPGYEVNDQIVFDQVLLMGTDNMTVLGRPYVTQCKVYATIEEQTLAQKKVTYKYKQKKGVRKSKNKKQRITVLKVDKIEFTPDASILQRAVRMDI